MPWKPWHPVPCSSQAAAPHIHSLLGACSKFADLTSRLWEVCQEPLCCLPCKEHVPQQWRMLGEGQVKLYAEGGNHVSWFTPSTPCPAPVKTSRKKIPHNFKAREMADHSLALSSQQLPLLSFSVAFSSICLPSADVLQPLLLAFSSLFLHISPPHAAGCPEHTQLPPRTPPMPVNTFAKRVGEKGQTHLRHDSQDVLSHLGQK